MNNNLSCLEDLPNEILCDILKYLDASDLFRAIHNLNFRFNALIRSLQYICLTLLKFHPYETNYYKNLMPNIYTLKLGYKANINLNDFPNIRRLELLVPSYEQLKQLESNVCYYLEYLSIGYKHILFSNELPNLCKKIFSNGFPYLKSCDLFEPKIIYIPLTSIKSVELHFLRVDHITFSTYQTILLTCPNLYFLQFTIYFPWKEACFIKEHFNLQRMIIKFEDIVSLDNSFHINDYISCVPALKQLIIYQMNYAFNIKKYLKYDWFVLIINQHLPLLQQFQFHLSFIGTKKSFQFDNKSILNHMIENFKNIHNNRYRSKLNFNILQ
ncbi:unnamed protein product [Adineta steineri]|uniref:F-box domain-containing protein n=1 Tax=Adineta steineri TaxID=433720 RepID=A0A814AH44_9BILA|nr:unnamed protein product [Adineta steineri]CAF3973954.1 unnamed protein product [Adineta steineri]